MCIRDRENCILAVTGDHGEEFLDHGARYHPPSRLMEELIHVPLLLRVPGIAKKEQMCIRDREVHFHHWLA